MRTHFFASFTAAIVAILGATSVAAAGDGCRGGFVWRETIPTDHVCVPPESRQQARDDNAAAPGRINPTNHDYGPDTCVGGFVWREAFQGDHVCVRPEIRTLAARENALAGTRVYQGPETVGGARPPIVRGPLYGGPIIREDVRERIVGVGGRGERHPGNAHHGDGGHHGGGHHGGGGHGGQPGGGHHGGGGGHHGGGTHHGGGRHH